MRIVKFFAREADGDLCRESVDKRAPITILGMTAGGTLQAFTGQVVAIERDDLDLHPGYPLRVTMRLATVPPGFKGR